MKYTPYFSRNLKLNGPPHLNSEMFALYMNIIHLEGRVEELMTLEANEKENDQKFVYRLKMDKLNDKVLTLTNSMEPKELLVFMLERSLS